MKLKVTRTDTWMATVEDRAGGAADRLEPFAKAGVNLEFAFARRTPENPGKGLIVVYPVKGAKAARAAQEAGFAKSDTVHTVRFEGGDKPGMSARITRALGSAGVSVRAFTATAIGRKFVGFVALDSADDAARAAAALKKVS
jgi:hypothetical protein